MALTIASLLCPFIVVTNIFTLKKDTAKMHYNNIGFNLPNNAPLAVFVRHWLIMGFKIDNSPVDVQMSKMEATIENIVFLVTTRNFAVNQIMEHEAVVAIIGKVGFIEEPKWTTVMAKNVP
jgi:hypothetical protein